MENNLNAKSNLELVYKKNLTPFAYLKIANDYLSTPIHIEIGREYIIRALDKIDLFQSNKTLLQNLVRKSGLYPYMDKYFPELPLEEKIVLDLYRSNIDQNFIFHSMQAKIFNLLMSGKNVVLSAPTSMGKSAIIDSAIASNKYNKIVIVVPTIALIDETRRRIYKRFKSEYQIIHHTSQETRKQKAVYVLTQERVNDRDDLNNIDLFIIDEFYKLAYSNDDQSRVISLNIALSKLLLSSKQFYMIGPYIDAIQGLENLTRSYIFIPSDFNTVALNIHKFDISPNDLEAKNHRLGKIFELDKGHTIIYCKSQNSITQVSQFLTSLSLIKDQYLISPAIQKLNKWVTMHYGYNWIYSQALRHGIGLHHGALPRALQQKTIDLFNKGDIKYLICTSTIIEGVNTIAENVVIYDNRKSTSKIDGFTHKNISGRAGRMNKHLIGNVFCLEPLPIKGNDNQVVDLPLGQQDENTPLNLLAGIQNEHLSDSSSEKLNHFSANSDIPISIIKKHSAYKVETIASAYEFILELEISEMKSLASFNKPNSSQLHILTKFIKIVEHNSLSRLKLHFPESDSLQDRLSWYIYDGSHSKYLNNRIKHIYKNNDDKIYHSDSTDKELKITRNIFKHSVPKALMLFQDLLNFELESLELSIKVDFGLISHIFEHSHMPSSFSALEEMGIPIETLEKLSTKRLSESSIDSLTRYISMNYKYLKQLDSIDHMFIEQALY